MAVRPSAGFDPKALDWDLIIERYGDDPVLLVLLEGLRRHLHEIDWSFTPTYVYPTGGASGSPWTISTTTSVGTWTSTGTSALSIGSPASSYVGGLTYSLSDETDAE